MSLEVGEVLLGNYKAVKALGNKLIDADAQFVIDGYEQWRFVFKEFPHPAPLTSGDPAESFGPNGQKFWQATNPDTAQQGSFVLVCFEKDHTEELLRRLLREVGGTFNATVYNGTMEANLRGYRIRDCVMKLDTGTRSQENKSQVYTLSGQLSFHFFDEEAKGNVNSLYSYAK